MITFPRVGSTKTVQVYAAPKRAEGEPDATFTEREAEYEIRKGVTVTVTLLPREKVRMLAYEYSKVFSDDAKAAKAAGTEGMTAAGIGALLTVHTKVLTDTKAVVSGVEVDGEDLATVSDYARLAQMLDDVDMLSPVAVAAKNAQEPTPTQKN